MKQLCDIHGNNPLHKACRFRNATLIKLLLDKNIGAIDERNAFGKLPLEMPHNDILNDPRIKEVFKNYMAANEKELLEKKVNITLNKEPDYMFVVKWDRKDVLTD